MALVYDPLTGKMVDDGRGVPGNPARAAAMQAQYNQPVTGPRGVVGAAPVSNVIPNAINVGGAAADVLLGGLSTIPAAALDVARTGATQLLGGDTSTLSGGAYARTNAAVNRMSGGLDALGQASGQLFGQAQAGLLGALGAQPATPGVTTPRAAVATPVVAPLIPAAPAPAAAPAMLDTTAINAQIAESLGGLRPQGTSLQASVRGNYNAQNTDLGALAQRAAPTNGINFGFGVGGAETAQQYLARMQQVDQQRAAQRQQTGLMNEARWARHTLANNPTVGEMAGARAQLAALNPQINTLMQNQGGLAQMGLRNQGDLATTGLQNEGLLLRAGMDAQARLGAADIAGQYGLREAALKSEASQIELRLESMTPTSRKASAEAALLETRLNAIRDEVEAGGYNNSDVVAATRAGQERAPVPTIDPITGVPYTADEIALIQARRLREEQARQQ